MIARRAGDRRPIDKWRSDTRRTFRDWLFTENIPQATRKRFKRFFGKLTITYTPSRMIVEFRGDRTVKRYEVLGTDPSSVAIRSWNPDASESEINHIRFTDQHYWIVTAAGQREFFRKVIR